MRDHAVAVIREFMATGSIATLEDRSRFFRCNQVRAVASMGRAGEPVLLCGKSPRLQSFLWYSDTHLSEVTARDIVSHIAAIRCEACENENASNVLFVIGILRQLRRAIKSDRDYLTGIARDIRAEYRYIRAVTPAADGPLVQNARVPMPAPSVSDSMSLPSIPMDHQYALDDPDLETSREVFLEHQSADWPEDDSSSVGPPSPIEASASIPSREQTMCDATPATSGAQSVSHKRTTTDTDAAPPAKRANICRDCLDAGSVSSSTSEPPVRCPPSLLCTPRSRSNSEELGLPLVNPGVLPTPGLPLAADYSCGDLAAMADEAAEPMPVSAF